MRLRGDKLKQLYSQARALLESCELCPRKCRVNRLAGEKGFCGVSGEGHIWRELVNDYEESILNPSHQLYFSGCNLRCAYCAVWEENINIPRPLSNTVVQSNAKTLNLLGGEPAVNIAAVLKLLSSISFDGKVVWNSNMYYSKAVSRLAAQFTDIYLADFKCFSGSCCRDILGAADYKTIAQERLLEASRTGQTVIVRHLLLPGHIDCCLRPVAEWVKENLPGALFSLRDNFCPFPERTNCPSDYLKEAERRQAGEIVRSFHLNTVM